MKNLKKLKRSELNEILGGDKVLPPVDQCTGQYPTQFLPVMGLPFRLYLLFNSPICCFMIKKEILTPIIRYAFFIDIFLYPEFSVI
jgi:hypothetical protein